MGAKSNQGAPSNTNQVVNTGPWAPQQPFITKGFDAASANYDAAQNNTYYGGETVAPFNPAQSTALNTTIGIGSGVNPGVAAAGRNNADTLNGKYLTPDSNPYIGKTFDAAADAVTRQYQTATAPQTAGAMASAGRYGSGAYNNQVKNNELGLGTTLGNLGTSIFGNNYQQERQNQMTAAGQAGGINSAQYINPAAALTAGNQQQTQQQNTDLSNMAAYNYNRDQPTNALNNYMAQIGGNYGTSGMTQSGTSTPYYTNPGASGLGAGLGIASLFSGGSNSAASGIGNIFSKSDRRLKENIRLIGKSFDGQNIYVFNFIDDPRVQIGLMAQEVQKRVPEAVRNIDGVLHVDYAAALKAA